MGEIKATSALLNTWYNTGGGSFLEMNALAEDLRLLQDKAGFGFVLHDLCDDQLCLPTWHMIHTAALFERARQNAVREFIEAKDNEAPDFIVEIESSLVSVEAKLLMESAEQLLFSSVARRIEESMMGADMALPGQTSALLVMKQPITAGHCRSSDGVFAARCSALPGHAVIWQELLL